MREWLTLELTPRGESEDPDALRKSLSHSLKGLDVFIPVAITKIGGDRSIHFLMEGYAFVQLDRARLGEYFKLEGSKYVQGLLLKPGSGDKQKRIAVVPDNDIARMKGQIRKLVDQGISVGDQVTITSGPYKNITATVLEDILETDMVQVLIKLRSQESLLTLPRSFLVVQERTPYSAISVALTSLKDWVVAATPIVNWDADFTPVLRKHAELTQILKWSRTGKDLYDLVTFDTTFKADLNQLKTKYTTLAQVDSWTRKFQMLSPLVEFFYDSPSKWPLGTIDLKLKELSRLESFLERMRTLWDDLDSLAKAQARKQEGKGMVQNVVVDGHNLMFRGKDSRPPAVINNFLQGLAALKTRFPEATLYVTWDGSARRRKAKFGEYQATRQIPAHPGTNPVESLFDLLPLLGVRQAWNADEEAVDVMATLVKGLLAKQTNLVFSTNKDLMQLVTPTTSLLIPAIGSRNEILFNPAGVEKALGVSPDKTIQLRALYGDASDNIPGVPRVPKKILRSLVQAHGSVEGVYRSGLLGVSKGQYERLRSAEPQVRINVELLSLTHVEVSHIPSDVDPETAARVLKDLDINPDSLFETFFGQTS